MRLMAHGRWVGVRCDQYGRRAASAPGLRGVLTGGVWSRHVRSLNRHLCEACVHSLPKTQRAKYVRELAPPSVLSRTTLARF